MSQTGPSSFKKLFSKKVDEERVEEEILSMVEEGHEYGVIEETEAEMISNIFEFSDKDAKDIMTSRQKIIGMENNLIADAALKMAIECNFSRYPIYDGDIDNIIGVVHIKDLISAYMKNPYTKIADIIEEPIFIHPTFNISKLLEKMQHEKIHMSIVLDEYGQTEGLVTMEDIIEEIVGNILDEHDDETKDIVCMPNGEYLVAGVTNLEELSDTLDIKFPDEDFETLNGFLLFQLGKLPVEGEDNEVVYEGYKFIPIKICDKMIDLVKILKHEEISKEDKE